MKIDSGAFQWDAGTRANYANDLGEPRGLVPTTTALNYSKVADDPQWYVPKVNACRYISSWIAVKLRWNLTVDQCEKAAIDRVVKTCPDAKFTVERAKIGLLPSPRVPTRPMATSGSTRLHTGSKPKRSPS